MQLTSRAHLNVPGNTYRLIPLPGCKRLAGFGRLPADDVTFVYLPEKIRVSGSKELIANFLKGMRQQ